MEIRPILSTLLRQRTGPLLVALQVAISLAILANALFVVQQRIAVSQRPSGVANEHDVGYVFIRPLDQRVVGNMACRRRGTGRRKVGRKKRRMRAKIRHRK